MKRILFIVICAILMGFSFEAGAQKVAALIGDAIRADKRSLLFKRMRP